MAMMSPVAAANPQARALPLPERFCLTIRTSGRSRQEIAVKVVRAELAADPEFRMRFGQKVAAARRAERPDRHIGKFVPVSAAKGPYILYV